MTNFERVGNGNILLVYGSDVYGDDHINKLREFLYGPDASASPVRRGTHDFWIVYTAPQLGDGYFFYGDLSGNPRKMRGIINAKGVPNNTEPDTLKDHLHFILQEVGHRWLVPQALKIRVDGNEVGLPTEYQMTQQINDGTPFSGPPLIARGNSHWSIYYQADTSPMDGSHFVNVDTEDGFSLWREGISSGPEITPPGLNSLRLKARYNDLDLFIMGVKRLHEAYSGTGGRFRWLEPRLTAPLNYHIGVCVAFSRYDYFYFGFHNDHRKLGVQRTGSEPNNTIELGSDYHPLGHEYNGVALRVVRRGNRYYFQARYDNPLGGCLAAALSFLFPRTPSLFEDIDHLPQPDTNASFKSFRTVAIIPRNDQPQAVGLIVKKLEQPYLAEGAFYDLQLLSNGNRTVLRTNVVPPTLPSGLPPENEFPFSALPMGELRFDNPTGKAIIRSKDRRLHIITPFSTPNSDGSLDHHDRDGFFDHGTDNDGAPKVLTKAPDGDFAFGTSCKVYRTIFTPWAGGFGSGKTMWGKEKTARVTDVIVPQDNIDQQPPPPDNTYKMAFIIVATQRSDITDDMIQRADIIRRYWDPAFEAATIERRHSNSVL